MAQLTEILHSVPNKWQDLKPHPLAAVVDFGAGMDLAGLAESMKQNGYDPDEAIVMLDGFILDGRHRHQAAKIAGVVPTFRRFIGKDPIAYVRKKIFRQHLSASQRAMLAAALAGTAHGGARQGDSFKSQNCGLNQTEAAEALKVSPRSVSDAKLVTEAGSIEQQEAVRSGVRSVSSVAEEIRNTRQAGDEEPTPPPSKPRNKPDPNAPKNGAPQFSLRTFKDLIKQALREVDKLLHDFKVEHPKREGQDWQVRETPEYLGVRRLMEEFATQGETISDQVEKWKNELKRRAGS